jgi:glycosyltransferase involved in cell wall biosynthesis
VRSVTVLVSVYNKAGTVKACIDSLLKLTYPQKLIFVVDGYSKDGSFEILQGFGDKIGLFRVPGNYSTALNWAIERIDTEFIALTDADCVVESDWLNKLLEPFDTEIDIVATAGFCTMPENGTLLQKMIGKELENRFRHFPKYLKRAPTMNFCLKKDIAMKVKFDEHQEVAVEVEFGYRLTKFGKIRYTPSAIVYHNHRNTLIGYFKQQKDQVKWACRILLKHKNKFADDPLNPFSMLIQIPVMGMFFIFLIFSIFKSAFIFPAIIMFCFLLIIYLFEINALKIHPSKHILWLSFLSFRAFAWIIGIVEACIHFMVKDLAKNNDL